MTDPRSGRSIAIANAWAATALLTGSVEPIAAKLGFRADASPWELQLARSTVAALVILPLTRRIALLSREHAQRVALAGALLFTTSTLMLFALARLHVADVIAILSITPATVAIATWARGGAPLGRRFVIGMLASIAGVALTTGAIHGGIDDAVGVLCALGAVLSSTTYRLTLEKLTRENDPAVVSTWIYLVHGVLGLVLLAPFVGMPSTAAWTAGSWTGVAAGVSNVAFVAALAGLGAPRASVVMLLQRPIIVVAAAVVLAEPLGVEEAGGIALVVLGVALSKPAP